MAKKNNSTITASASTPYLTTTSSTGTAISAATISAATISGGSSWSNTYSKVLENETKVLDLEKILLIEDKNKRKILLKLIMNYSRCDNSEIEKLLKNTLESYNLIIEKKALERKIKISSLMNDDENK
jgi:hypothetical protein